MNYDTSRRGFLRATAASVGALGLGVQPLWASVKEETAKATRKPRMKIGCCAYSYRDYLKKGEMSLEDFIEVCADMGLDGVQLTTYYYESTEPEYLHGLKRLAYHHGLDIPSIATRTDFCQPDPKKRAQQAEEMKKWIDVAVELGANAIRVFGGKIPKGRSPDEAVEWTVDGLMRSLDYAEQKGIILALENHGGVTESADLVLRIRSKIDSPWFGLLLDTANFRQDTYNENRKVAPHAVTAHVKTEVFTPDGGKKDVDVERIVRTLADAGYRGYLHVEYEAEEEPREAIPRFVEKLRRTVNQITGA